VARITDLEQDKRMRYVLVFKNHGEGAGAHTIFHSISQLMDLPVTPRNIKTKLTQSPHSLAFDREPLFSAFWPGTIHPVSVPPGAKTHPRRSTPVAHRR
jgi:galactose-1-phosphate uridylyltransferase